MRPHIDGTDFGWIVIDGVRFGHDIVIELDGTVRKRRKKLSKTRYGTSHTISVEEAEDVYRPGCKLLLVGAGAFGQVRLSDEAQTYFDERGVTVEIMLTGEAIGRWNALEGAAIGLFHVTC
jgi:hypothetical protein